MMSQEHLKNLKDIFPNTGLAHLWNIPDHVQDVCCEMEVTTIPDPLILQMEKMLFTNANKQNSINNVSSWKRI